MKHYEIKAERLNRRAQATLDYLLALAIGVSLAMALVAWWSE